MTTDSNDANKPDADKSGSPTGSESDIMALKRAHEAEIRERDAQIKTLTDEVASERAAKEAAEAKLVGLTEVTEERDKLKAELETVSKAAEEAKAAALNTRRQSISRMYNLENGKLDNMNEAQLDALESVLPDAKPTNVPAPANLDVSGGGSGPTEPGTAREKIKAGL